MGRHSIATAIDIAAPPERVWEVLMDFVSYPDWNPFVVELTGDPVVGEKLRARMTPPGGRAMKLAPTVTAAEANRVFEWVGVLATRALFEGRHRFELHATDAGTRLDHGEQFRGLLVPLLRKMLDGSTRDGFVAMNEALKVHAEAT